MRAPDTEIEHCASTAQLRLLVQQTPREVRYQASVSSGYIFEQPCGQRQNHAWFKESVCTEYTAKNQVELLRLVVHAMCNQHPRQTAPERPGAPVQYEYLNRPGPAGEATSWGQGEASVLHYILLPGSMEPKEAQNPDMESLMNYMVAGTDGTSQTLQLQRKATKASNPANTAYQLYPSPRFLQFMACARTLQMMLSCDDHIAGMTV